MDKKKDKKQLLKFLCGKHKTDLLLYAIKKRSFYQAEASSDLHLPISTTQYYLKKFVEYQILDSISDSYRTYYHINLVYLPMFLKLASL